VDPNRINDSARQDVGANFRTLFEHDDGEVRVDLLQTDRCGQAGRASPHDYNVEFHALAFYIAHRKPPRPPVGTQSLTIPALLMHVSPKRYRLECPLRP